MTLTTNGKNYIGKHFGNSSRCYVLSGLNWTTLGTDDIPTDETGGTAQIVGRLVLQQVNKSVTISGTTYIYEDLRAANYTLTPADAQDVFFTDAQWITQNDGSIDGEPQYCAPTTGDVSLESNPPGARIFIDNIDTGLYTPNTITGLTDEIHTYNLVLTGHLDNTGNFTIIAGQTIVIPTITLVVTICSWITGLPGIENINPVNIGVLTDANLGIGNIGFTPTIPQVFGTIYYYIGFTNSGNVNTGCSF